MNAISTGEWLSRDRVMRVATVCAILSVLTVIGFALTSRGTLDITGRPLGTDFSNIWTAGRMALDGQAAAVWSWPDHFAVQRAVHGEALTELFGWHYPPPFLLLASALATLPYLTALAVWQLATLLPLLWLLHRMVPRREMVLVAAAAPVTLICLLHGHNGFLTALLLGGGLFLLDRRPFVAGLLFGCLLYKPQFAIVIPVLLLAGREWRAIAGACVAVAALILATLVAWGWPVWAAFIDSLPLTRSVIIEQGAAGFHKIMTPFAAVRGWGGPVPLAYAVQAAVTTAVVAITGWFGWRRGSADLRNAWVCVAVLLSTPYALDYDFVVLLPAAAFIWRDGEREGWRSWERSMLAFAWIALPFARQATLYLFVPLGLLCVLGISAIVLRRVLAPERRQAIAAAA